MRITIRHGLVPIHSEGGKFQHETYSMSVNIPKEAYDQDCTYGVVFYKGRFHARNYKRQLKSGNGIHWLEIKQKVVDLNYEIQEAKKWNDHKE